MAFTFQFLLTNFAIAAGISSGENPLDADDDAESWGKKVRTIESKVGIWTLLTANIAIFIACFLAVKLTLISSVILSAITGVVIWSAYFFAAPLGEFYGSGFLNWFGREHGGFRDAALTSGRDRCIWFRFLWLKL
ncbi:hypothetical protein [Coleofasciculus sp. H7-2]|uniref:hypothetical protein n=1 Tax=Coleofasciculus sp. H7-2 TaxID=3351545 RepID=UPI00366DCDB7